MYAEIERTLAVVLAGGAGSRVGGADKGLLPLAGRPLIEHVLDGLQSCRDSVVIAANRHLGIYARYVPALHDAGASPIGPLAGLVAAFAFVVANRHALPDWLLTVPGDCPDPPRDLASRLQTALIEHADALCSFAQCAGVAEPLFAMYRLGHDPDAWLARASDALQAHGSVRKWHTEIHALAVDFDDTRAAFHNLNTPAEFNEYERAHDAA